MTSPPCRTGRQLTPRQQSREAWIKEEVDRWPPLTPDQLAALSVILAPVLERMAAVERQDTA